jgi:hypothetical protein
MLRRKELDMPADSEKHSSKSGEMSGAGRAKRAASGPELSADLISFTINVKSGRIAMVETVDPSGDRHELTAEETSRIARQRVSTLEDILERAFEAGISSVLDNAPLEEPEAESEEESKLRRLILRPMIERSAARHLLKREVLGRAILGTLIQDAAASRTTASAPKAARAPSRPTASASRRPPPRGRPH